MLVIKNDTDKHWVTFYTKPRAEKKAYAQLLRAGFEPYLPLQRRLHKWHDRKKWVDVPLFNSYIFVRIPFNQLYNVLEQPNVTRYVRFGDEIAVLSQKELDTIQRLLDSERELFVQNMSQLRKGARVRLLAGGVFEGLEGELVSDNKNGNFAVRIQCVSSVILLEMDRQLMELVEPDESVS